MSKGVLKVVDFFGCGPTSDWCLEVYNSDQGFQEFYQNPLTGRKKTTLPVFVSKYYKLPRYHPLSALIEVTGLAPEFRICGCTPLNSAKNKDVLCFLEKRQNIDGGEPTYNITSGVFSGGNTIAVTGAFVRRIPEDVHEELVTRSPFCMVNGYSSNIRNVLFGHEAVIINFDFYSSNCEPKPKTSTSPLSLWKEDGWTYILIRWLRR